MSQMVQMYHPNIPSTVDEPVEVALQSVDDHAAHGWLLVDPDEELPTPATPYYTTAAADSRFVRGTQLATKMAEHVGDGSAFDLAQRAASVAAVAEDIDDSATDLGAAARVVSAAAIAGQPDAADGRLLFADSSEGGGLRWGTTHEAVARALGWAIVTDPQYGAVGNGTTDDTAAVQAAIDGAVRGRGRNVFFPSGTYKITATIIVPGDVHLSGAGAQPGESFGGGSALWWYGPTGMDAVVTSINAESDWSRGEIRNLRIVSKTNDASIGLHVRNPQNCATLDNVTVVGFRTRGILVEETKTTGTVGATPGVFSMKRVFAIGGIAPIEIKNGSQPVTVDDCSADTDAFTSEAGFLITPGLVPSAAPRWPVSFRGTKVEIATTTTSDVAGWKVTANAPISWDACEVQRNAGLGTRGAIEHTNATRKWARFSIRNMAVWNMAYGLRLTSAGLDIANPSGTGPWAFGFEWHQQTNFAVTYYREALTASMNGAGVRVAGAAQASGNGLTMPSKGVLTAMTAEASAAITAGSVTAQLLKNGSAALGQQVLDASNQTRRQDLMSPDIASGNQVFAAGDRIGCFVGTTSDLAPAGSLALTVTAFIRLFSEGG